MVVRTLAPMLLLLLCLLRGVKKTAAVGGMMSQGIEFNRLMLEMRAMQTDAMARS